MTYQGKYMKKTQENPKKMSCADQLIELREFYNGLTNQICDQLKLTHRTLNRRIAIDSFSVAESEMIRSIIENKKNELCA